MNRMLKASLGASLALGLSLPALSFADSLNISQAAQVRFCLDTNGVFLYNIKNPRKANAARFLSLEPQGDLSSEGLLFIPKSDNNGWLVVANEIGKTVSVYNVSVK